MTEIIIISLLVLILCVELVRDVLLLKIVSAMARAEPDESVGLPIFKKEARVQINTKTFHEKWEEAKKVNV